MKVHVVSGVLDEELFGTLVVVDVLRSSSTIVAALSNGAKAIIPFTDAGDAIKVRGGFRHSSVVLVGEKNGITPRGFDYNISPFDMSKENVEGKTILYTSTNLTRVLGKLRGRNPVTIGGIVNAKATADYLRSTDHDATIIACGTPKGTTVEDMAGAGAIASYLMSNDLSDDALVTAGFYKNPKWRSLVKRGHIAKRLLNLGFRRDIDFCLSPNISPIVPGLRGNKIVNLRQKK